MLGLLLGCLSGCSSLLSEWAEGVASDFASTVQESDDPVTLEAALPPYLLALDVALRSHDDNESLLTGAADLNGAYATAFVRDAERAQRFADKSMAYAMRALCLHDESLCQPHQITMEALQAALRGYDDDDVGLLFTAASAWASWIQMHSADWSAVADLPRVRLLVERCVALDGNYRQGMPYVYLGVLDTLLPPALGGKPEAGRVWFEKALAVSQGHNLMAKVVYARSYARLVYDRELHDRLLNEVLQAEVRAPGLTLANVLAQREAKALLAGADEYF